MGPRERCTGLYPKENHACKNVILPRTFWLLSFYIFNSPSYKCTVTPGFKIILRRKISSIIRYLKSSFPYFAWEGTISFWEGESEIHNPGRGLTRTLQKRRGREEAEMLHLDSSHPLGLWVFFLFPPPSFFKFQKTVVKNSIEKLGVPARRMGMGFVGWVNTCWV